MLCPVAIYFVLVNVIIPAINMFNMCFMSKTSKHACVRAAVAPDHDLQ